MTRSSTLRGVSKLWSSETIWNLQQVLLNLFFKQPSILTQVNQISPKSRTPRESLVKPSSSPEMVVGPWSEVPKGLWRRTGRLAPFWRTTGCGRCFNPPWMICGANMGIYIHDVHVYTYVYARPNTHTFIHIYIYIHMYIDTYILVLHRYLNIRHTHTHIYIHTYIISI